jgi:hypothetical protein
MGEESVLPPWDVMTTAQSARWAQVLDLVAQVVPPGTASVVVDGGNWHSPVVADRLAATLRSAGAAGGPVDRPDTPRGRGRVAYGADADDGGSRGRAAGGGRTRAGCGTS